MMGGNGIMYCDKCKKDFPHKSTPIEKTTVDVEGDVLLLYYFTCPHCNAVYRVLLVEETRYRELVDDLTATQRRIYTQQGKGKPMLMHKLQNMDSKKQKRIENYASRISQKYPGSFVLATKNDQHNVVYIP